MFNNSFIWELPNNTAIFRYDSVHVWIADFKHDTHRKPDRLNTLSRCEMERANRYRFEKDQYQFATTRRILRKLLSGYLDQDPRSISIKYNEYGKPSIDCQSTNSDILFNLSHSGSYALFAFSASFDLGVDVERIQLNSDLESIAKSHFSAIECDQISHSNFSKKALFYNCWTRKEAVVKALGKGLTIPLDSFSVETQPFANGEDVDLLPHSCSFPKMKLYNLDFGDSGYSAALAVLGNPKRIQFYKYDFR